MYFIKNISNRKSTILSAKSEILPISRSIPESFPMLIPSIEFLISNAKSLRKIVNNVGLKVSPLFDTNRAVKVHC